MGSIGCLDRLRKVLPKLLVLHGFNSAGENQKAIFLRRHLSAWEVLAPSYSHDPRIAGPALESLVESELLGAPRAAVLGTSLGAYYARYLGAKYGLATVMINPVIDALETMAPALGAQQNFRTGEHYRFDPEHLAALVDYRVGDQQRERLLVLLDLGDELLDSVSTVAAFANHASARVVCYEGGEHRFAHLVEALPEISRFLTAAG